ncbi:leucine-rich repeat protein [Fadolivirus algeromassiliense]|jgi:hypothetical protein|uniref:Leucine-rich repeat protein n=1 Tax=Fadolivirus FV1/VV64 TaxID=3070911 RepID=A0A7D3URH5_9VIRU|nr:leucine-rich repeat protein [Fadolivirus algeromassiliense]QKF94673.1 leucine-rich repeat protein [Fadolivirus FV1/VV64]
MYEILLPPVVEVLFKYLTLSDIFNFLATSSESNEFSYYVYNNYKFKYSSIKDQSHDIKNQIKNLIIDLNRNDLELNEFTNLKTVYIQHNDFNSPLDFIPITIKEIHVTSHLFNKQITDVFPKLQKLVIKSMSFNAEIEESLINRITDLSIDSPTYTKLKSSDGIKVKTLMTKVDISCHSIESFPSLHTKELEMIC